MSSRVFAVVVTYRRPDDVTATLHALQRQSLTITTTVVVDNEPSAALERHVASLAGHVYLPMADNGGPAGGIAAGMSHILTLAADDDWIVLVDDDNPPTFDDQAERLLRIATDDDVGGVGGMGAAYDRRRGRLVRIADERLISDRTIDVDYLGGNQLPIYRVKAIRATGVFDPHLFFGYEELEFGLRMRNAGWRLIISGDVGYQLRDRWSRLGLSPATANRRRPRGAWRVYYGTRNQVVIARRHGTRRTQLTASSRALLGAGRSLLALQPREATFGARGLFDGWRGHLGRTIDPGRA
jgi:glycosyltransferase involved in cell wall biosynthesis